MRVLLVGGYEPMVKALKQGLEEERYAVDVSRHGQEENGKAPAADYDAIVYDLTRPETAGLSRLRCWRRAGLKAPVLVLTTTGGIDDTARGADSGPDDWLTKPFELEELFARLRALVRRP